MSTALDDGKTQSSAMFPRRIVCLSAEAAETIYRLGAADRLVGVTAYAKIPGIPRVGGFSAANVQKILALQPDLVVAYSYVQRDVVAELIEAGVNVLVTHQTTLEEITAVMEMLGRLVGRSPAALVEEFWRELQPRTGTGVRPRVYVEEWPDPPVTGVAWVSQLIERAGGVDVFADYRSRKTAQERVVTDEEILRRQPAMVIASWCGRPVEPECLRRRLGNLPVREVASDDLLQPGPALTRGYRQLCRILETWSQKD